MRRLTFTATMMTGLLAMYALSPIGAWLSLAGVAVFMALRRAHQNELQPLRLER